MIATIFTLNAVVLFYYISEEFILIKLKALRTNHFAFAIGAMFMIQLMSRLRNIYHRWKLSKTPYNG